MGIHKWEPDTYIGFSPDLNLQCRTINIDLGGSVSALLIWAYSNFQIKISILYIPNCYSKNKYLIIGSQCFDKRF
jgi:hypothetical protein